MFHEHLKKIVQEVEGGLGGVIMGLDGIPVETYMANQEGFDVNIIGMEFSFILTQVKRAAEALKVGGVREFTVKAEKLLFVIRMVTDEYFIAVAGTPDANFGKARFMLRLTAPRIVRELS